MTRGALASRRPDQGFFRELPSTSRHSQTLDLLAFIMHKVGSRTRSNKEKLCETLCHVAGDKWRPRAAGAGAFLSGLAAQTFLGSAAGISTGVAFTTRGQGISKSLDTCGGLHKTCRQPTL